MKNIQNILNTAVTIAEEAGELLKSGFEQEKEIVIKSTAVDWVTQYDKAAETLITNHLHAAFPDHGIVGEEGSQKVGAENHVWYVDPLDGTTNFAHSFPVFCVSMALYDGANPLLGVIYDPLRDECFTAVAGQGARLSKKGVVRPLQVSRAETLITSLLATGFPYDRHHSDHDNVAQFQLFLKRGHGVRRAGAAALDLAYVAAGRLDGYWEYKLNSWDVAAGMLLVQEAGGLVTSMQGEPAVIAPQVDLIASNGRIHQQMVDVLN